MKGRKHTPEQIIRKLREADQLAGQGQEQQRIAECAHQLCEWHERKVAAADAIESLIAVNANKVPWLWGSRLSGLGCCLLHYNTNLQQVARSVKGVVNVD